MIEGLTISLVTFNQVCGEVKRLDNIISRIAIAYPSVFAESPCDCQSKGPNAACDKCEILYLIKEWLPADYVQPAKVPMMARTLTETQLDIERHLSATFINGKSGYRVSDYNLRCLVGMLETGEAIEADFQAVGGDVLLNQVKDLQKEISK